MARLRLSKTSFTAGEVSPRLLGRGDLRSYENGARRLRNVFIHPTGGLSRRAGLRYVDTVAGEGRLVAFEFNTEQVYLLVFTDARVDVYKDGVKTAGFDAPWTLAQIAQINWTQSADTLLVVHPDVPPKKITRTSHTDWTIADWTFLSETKAAEGSDPAINRIHQPHHKFAGDDVTLSPSGTTGSITLTASADVFAADHAGLRLRVQDKEVEVTAFTSATQVSASVKEDLPNTEATKDWEEPAFSTLRGWPVSVCFHQDRMIIGGSRDLPNRLWMSRSSDLYNFGLGEGLDDEAIEFAILSDQVNAIRAVFSGRHLQVFTSGAEWMVSGDPLTPGNVQLKRQTRIGSRVDRTVPPRDVDGATLFVPRAGPELREFLFADVEQAYQASDLAMLAGHLLGEPIDQDFDTSRRLFHIVQGDGGLATLTIFRTQEVTAWSRQETDGDFLSVAVVGDLTYVLVRRGEGSICLERFDDALNVDSALSGTAEEPKTVWSGLDHLEGRAVAVLADGAVVDSPTVTEGEITLAEPVSEVQAGLAFAHLIEPLPPGLQQGQQGGQGGKVRLVSVTFRLQDTAALRVDVGKGLVDIPFFQFGDQLLDRSPRLFTGDKSIRAFGWKSGDTEALWRIEQDVPLAFSLLSVSTEVAMND